MHTIVSNGFVVLITAAFIILVYFVNFWWKRRRLRELGNKLPGPKVLPFIGNIKDVVGWTIEETLQKYLKVASMYTPTFRIWLGPRLLVVISDPVDLENLMNNHKCLGRDDIKDLLDKYPLGDGLFLLSGEKWKYHRKVIVPTFHYNILTSFVEIFNRNARILVKNLREGAEDSKIIDVLDYLTLCTFDNVCETVMGISMRSQEKNDKKYLDSMTEYFYMMVDMYLKPWLQIPLVFWLTPGYKKMKECQSYLTNFSEALIDKKVKQYRENLKDGATKGSESGKQRKAFLDLVIDSVENNNSTFSKKDIIGEINILTFTGFETAASNLSFLFMLLGFHQDIQAKVYEEISDIFGDDLDRPVTMEDFNKMRYVDKVIKESLRVYPVVPLIPREASEDIEINGYTIPKGSDVIFNIYSLHHNPKIYPDPGEFNPENFSAERCEGRHPYAYLPFSGGFRKCVGAKYAILQMKTVIATVIRHFVVQPACSRDEMKRLCAHITLRLAGGFKIRLEPRNKPTHGVVR